MNTLVRTLPSNVPLKSGDLTLADLPIPVADRIMWALADSVAAVPGGNANYPTREVITAFVDPATQVAYTRQQSGSLFKAMLNGLAIAEYLAIASTTDFKGYVVPDFWQAKSAFVIPFVIRPPKASAVGQQSTILQSAVVGGKSFFSLHFATNVRTQLTLVARGWDGDEAAATATATCDPDKWLGGLVTVDYLAGTAKLEVLDQSMAQAKLAQSGVVSASTATANRLGAAIASTGSYYYGKHDLQMLAVYGAKPSDVRLRLIKDYLRSVVATLNG